MINPNLYYLGLSLFVLEYIFNFIILSNHYKFREKIASYTLLQIIILTFCLILPSIIIPLIIYLLMFHFGEDFRYICNGNASSRWFGAILFAVNIFFNIESYTLIFKTFQIREETIQYLLITCVLLIIPSIIIIPWKIKNILVALFIFIIGYCKIIFGLVPYIVFIHMPLTIYRLNKNNIIYPFLAIISLIPLTIFIKSILFTSTIYTSIYFKYQLAGIIITHILFISYWKLKHL